MLSKKMGYNLSIMNYNLSFKIVIHVKFVRVLAMKI